MYDPLMHAPGSQAAHCLPVAGLRPTTEADVYRYNRVVPLYTPDPCIGPMSSQLICPPDCGQQRRNDLMEPAGRKTPVDMQFQFYQPRPTRPEPKPACSCPVFANRQPCTTLGPITDRLNCPCVNRQNMPQGHQHQVVISAGMQPPPRPMPQQAFLPQSAIGQPHARQFMQIGMRPNDTIPFPPPNTPAAMAMSQPMYAGMRPGAIAPTPETMMPERRHSRKRSSLTFRPEDLNVDYCCQNPYYPSRYVCRPVYDRKYLDDCPEQDGPPADTYTFL